LINKIPGLTVSIPLFFHEDESIDYKTLADYIKELGTQKYISAIYSMAYNTRYRMLSEYEVLELNIEILRLAKESNLVCYVGHPYIFDRQRLEMYLENIAKYNPAGISMLYPERYYGIDDPIIDFLKMPEKFGLKSVLHEMKLVSGFDGALINWPEKLLRKSIRLDSVIGVKEDSKDDNIAHIVLDECMKQSSVCILAGGGKLRALKFVKEGLDTWLNGTTMFCPRVIDKIYPAIMNNDHQLISFYIENIEKPFFDKIVKCFGWHLAHKAALQFFGYGSRHERFPHPIMPFDSYNKISDTLQNIKNSIEKL